MNAQTITLDDGRDLVLRDDVLTEHRAQLATRSPVEPTRLAYAAAHVVLQESYRTTSHSLSDPGSAEEIAAAVDWETTLGLRRYLDSRGFGIAEAMDTAQRFHLGWASARRLIEETGKLGLTEGFVAGAGVDHLDEVTSKADLISGVLEQVEIIRAAGGEVIILPMVWLPTNDATEADYIEVYTEIIRQADGPLYLHWLGEQFLPALKGYFPGESFDRIIAFDPAKVRGVKLSLLDDALELRIRREILPRDQIVLTGDDFHFGRLILGGDPRSGADTVPEVDRWTTIGGRRVALGDFSHALLGVLDGIADPASVALQWLAHGEGARFLELMNPCETLGQWVFQAPTQHYKAGLAFLSWLAGRQANFMLVNREEQARDRDHYLRLTDLASVAGVVESAPDAAARLREFLDGSSA